MATLEFLKNVWRKYLESDLSIGDLVIVSEPPDEKYKDEFREWFSISLDLYNNQTILKILESEGRWQEQDWFRTDYKKQPYPKGIPIPATKLSKIYEL